MLSLGEPHPVPGEHLGAVLVLDLDDAGRLDPGLSVHLDGNSLVAQDGDLYRATLDTHTHTHTGSHTGCD